ncbi:hypothetical protein ANTQUA_LOCUS3308 [Anthophora quadrimaculata]
MVLLSTLTKIAIVGGFIVAGTGYTMQYMIDRKLRKTTTYKKALQMLYDHPKAVQYLGEPIKEGNIKVTNQDEVKKFSVNLKGANTKGKLDCEFTVKPDLTTKISNLQIKFNNLPDKIFVIHET